MDLIIKAARARTNLESSLLPFLVLRLLQLALLLTLLVAEDCKKLSLLILDVLRMSASERRVACA